MAVGERRLPGDRVLRRPLHGRDGRHPRQPAREARSTRRRARHGRAARHGRRLFDGRHGRHHAGRRLLGRTRRGHRYERHHAGHVHQLSAASLKAFCGKHGGIVCTSSNAAAVLEWAFKRTSRVLFFPDQHLGRNTAKAMGIPLDQMLRLESVRVRTAAATRASKSKRARSCSGKVTAASTRCSAASTSICFRAKHPGIKILVHPECPMEVFDKADVNGSHEQDHPNRRAIAAGHQVGDRHGAAPGEPLEAAAPRAGDSLPLAGGLHVRDDVPHRSGPLVLEPRKPGRRHAGERDPTSIDETATNSLVALERMLAVK